MNSEIRELCYRSREEDTRFSDKSEKRYGRCKKAVAALAVMAAILSVTGILVLREAEGENIRVLAAEEKAVTAGEGVQKDEIYTGLLSVEEPANKEIAYIPPYMGLDGSVAEAEAVEAADGSEGSVGKAEEAVEAADGSERSVEKAEEAVEAADRSERSEGKTEEAVEASDGSEGSVEKAEEAVEAADGSERSEEKAEEAVEAADGSERSEEKAEEAVEAADGSEGSAGKTEEAVEAADGSERSEEKAEDVPEHIEIKSEELVKTYNPDMVKELSDRECEVLCRIVEAEATGHDIYGKMLVANVVLNRVNSRMYPDTVEEVVFQKIGSSYQFSPTCDGRYYTVKITKSTKKAVDRVLKGEDYSQGAEYFFSRKGTTIKKARWFDNGLRYLFKYSGHEYFREK